ncbi:MAG: M48 family metalloprotease [Desulfobacteraceae bacterium]|jgi:Zn-dependent protease with chaperone function
MFNNIIYFIVVLLVFELGQGDGAQSKSLFYSLSMIFISWFILVVYCRTGFKRLIRLYQNGSGSGYAVMYSRLILRLSVISIFIFSLDVFAFNLKFWIENIPVAENIHILQGLLAIILFILYLSTIWYFAHPAYKLVFNADIGKKAFILWNVKLNVPVIFPWLFLSLVFDLVSMSPWPKFNSYLERPAGQIIFFTIFLFLAMIFLPVLIRYFWGCRPLESSPKADSIRDFLKSIGLRYRKLVSWPLLGGKMMTAGIMGIIPGYRYILITESLMEILTPSELNAVMAHEAGHAKYNHQMLLSFFFLGYFILILGFSDLGFIDAVITYLIYQIPGDIVSGDIFTVLLAVTILVTMIIYFRFIMGFFMRNFERQADTYAALTMGDPSPIISSLEKIALLSGKIRDVPSWHHFSIKQRVDFLIKSRTNPGVIGRHRRFIISSLMIYLGTILSLAYLLYLTPVTKHVSNDIFRIINEQIEKKPGKAVEYYEKILSLDRKQPTALNNLAWLLLTADDPDIKDVRRGLELAKEAVGLAQLPEFLDTLAEAYWANGNNEMALQIEKEAIMRDKANNPHYRKQLEKFLSVKNVNL